MADGALLGRTEELARIAAMVATIPDGPRSLTLVGEAGIGKTSIWSAAIAAAMEHARTTPGRGPGPGRLTVCVARAVEAERALAFVVLTDLLAPLAPTTLPGLPAPQRAALAAAMLLDDGAGGGSGDGSRSPDPRALGMAVFGVLQQAASTGSVLLAIDDVQWVDPASAAALAFALRRAAAGGLPIGLLLTRRGDDALSGPAAVRTSAEPLSAALGDASVAVPLGPVSLGVLHHLVLERTGTTLTRPQLIRLEQASRSNPMLAIEIARELVVLGRWPMPGEPLPVPADTRALLARRLERLPPGGLETMWFIAALSAPTASRVAAASGRGLVAVEAAVAHAEAAGLLERDAPAIGPLGPADGDGDGRRLRFAHPLIAEACLDAVPAEHRRTLHRRLIDHATKTEGATWPSPRTDRTPSRHDTWTPQPAPPDVEAPRAWRRPGPTLRPG